MKFIEIETRDIVDVVGKRLINIDDIARIELDKKIVVYKTAERNGARKERLSDKSFNELVSVLSTI